MYRSLCIINRTLFFGRCSITSLLQYLSATETIQQDIEKSDQAQIFFKGNRDMGTYVVVGSAGAILAMPYLEYLNSETTDVIFERGSNHIGNNEVERVVYLLIDEDSYEDINLKRNSA